MCGYTSNDARRCGYRTGVFFELTRVDNGIHLNIVWDTYSSAALLIEPMLPSRYISQRLSIFEPTFISHIFTVTGRQNVFWTRCKHFFYSACDSNNLCGCLCPLITPPLRPVFATNNQILLITRPLSSGPHTEHMFQILSSFLSTWLSTCLVAQAILFMLVMIWILKYERGLSKFLVCIDSV